MSSGALSLQRREADDLWRQEALALEERIWAQARTTPCGDVVWLAPAPAPEGGKPVRLGPHLYNGLAGVALFLAAMDHVEGAKERRDPIIRALAPLRRQLTDIADRDPEIPMLLGGMLGLGAYIYAFILLGRWLDQQELWEEAAQLATLIGPQRIARDTELDILRGSAGAILALLALHRIAPGPRNGFTPLERALACGEHLLDRRLARAGEPRAWPIRERPAWCGFAHGAAGISYALARLWELTGERRFRSAAHEGIDFERLHYDPRRGNWRTTEADRGGGAIAWCQGAPGIVMGRIAMQHLLDGPELRDEIRAGLETTIAAPDSKLDFLCCGNLGRAEILLHACEVLREERLRSAAEEIAARAVRRSRGNGEAYALCSREPHTFQLSFFKGAAGLGYTFLRLARPSSLPCVLLLETWR